MQCWLEPIRGSEFFILIQIQEVYNAPFPKKTEKISCFEEKNVLSGGLEGAVRAWKSFREAG